MLRAFLILVTLRSVHGHCGLKVLLGQKHSRLLRTFLICVIVKSVHGYWDLSFILDHCCSEESCGHCGFKVSLLR